MQPQPQPAQQTIAGLLCSGVRDDLPVLRSASPSRSSWGQRARNRSTQNQRDAMSEQEIDLYGVVTRAVAGAVAIRAMNKLVPAEGEGGKVMPPTFSDRQYAWEDRERAVIT